MNASYGVYPASNGQYWSQDGLLWDTYEEAYAENVALGMIDDFNTPATYDPNYTPGSEVQPATVQDIVDGASAKPGVGTGIGEVLASMFNTTMTTAGSALNTRLNSELTLQQAKVNAQIAAINAPKAAVPATTTSSLLTPGLLIGGVLLGGLILVAGRSK